MSSGKRIVFVVVLFVLGMAGLGLSRVYRQPLGPGLELPTPTRAMPALATVPVQMVAAVGTETEIPATRTSTP